jgi:hypothetical protein
MTTPRIYTYKVTFEEIPYWYWGVHKEKKFGERYSGSPVTHKWVWEFYSPVVQILELFPNTSEGWVEAQKVEKRLIKPDLNNPFCLNEGCNGFFSLDASSRGGKKGGAETHKEKDEFGRSVRGVKYAERLHSQKDEFGRSVVAMRTLEKLHSDKDDLGRSTVSVRAMEKVHAKKDEFGRSVVAVKAGESAHKEKDELGRSLNGLRGAERLNSEKWEDPDHPELGQRRSTTLVKMQKARGLPHGRENRRKAG